jgi:hypothetical protein
MRSPTITTSSPVPDDTQEEEVYMSERSAMQEVRTGVWHWQAPHPDCEDGEPWDPNMSSYAIDDGERLLLFDPLGVPREIEERAANRETAIVLTAPWHERDSQSRSADAVIAASPWPAPDTA